MFIVKGNKIHLGFDNKYPENNQLKKALNMEKTVQMSGFISYVASYLLWVKLC